MNKIETALLRAIYTGALILLTMALLSVPLHCTVTSPTPNEPTIVSDINPNAVLIGSIASGQLITEEGDEDLVATALRVTPVGMKLFDIGIAFCGNVGSQVTQEDGSKFLSGDLVFTYRRAAPRQFVDVPCFDLVSVQPLGGK